MKKSFKNNQVSEIQVSLHNLVKVQRENNQQNFVLQRIHKFFSKIDALNLEYISRRW